LKDEPIKVYRSAADDLKVLQDAMENGGTEEEIVQ
jgi:hypothetical protein